MQKRMILLLGAPGAGKGTQAKITIDRLPDHFHISSDDFLREQMEKGTGLGKKCLEAGVDKGNYLSDEDMKNYVYPTIISTYPSTTLLDGVIRTIRQAKDFEDADGVIDLVLYLSLSKSDEDAKHILETRQKIIDRLQNRRACSSCKRSYNLQVPGLMPLERYRCRTQDCDGEIIQRRDDSLENITNKYDGHYLPKTFPLVEFYRNKGVLISVDAALAPEQVTSQIISALRQS